MYAAIEAVANNGKDYPTPIVINSPGGDAITGYAIAEFIEMLQHNGVRFIAFVPDNGWAASAAMIIYMAVNSRTAQPKARFMQHYAYQVNKPEIKHGTVILDLVNNYTLNVWKHKTKLNLNTIKMYFDTEHDYDYDEAVALGIITNK